MILVDTSVWAAHLNRADHSLEDLVAQAEVAMHPLVIEELACGNLRRRAETLALLRDLPVAPTVSHGEILALISIAGLYGTGIGAIDVHLLASARLGHLQLWTRDKALRAAAKRLSVLASEQLQ